MKNIFKLFLVSLVFTSCGDADTVIYDGSQNNPTFLSFTSSTIDFPIARTTGSDLVITLNSSTVSNVDRYYDIIVDEVASTADEALYDMPEQIMIPAGSYQGTAIVKGFDNDIAAEVKTIVFSLEDTFGASMDNEVITLQLFEVCPLNAPFTGQYAVSQVGPGAAINPGDAEIFGEDDNGNLPVITLAMGASEFERTITADVYPEVGAGFTTEFKLRLTCEGINLSGIADVGVGCGAGNTLKFGPGNINGVFNPNDDTSITFSVTEDQSASCFASRQVVLQLTKVN